MAVELFCFCCFPRWQARRRCSESVVVGSSRDAEDLSLAAIQDAAGGGRGSFLSTPRGSVISAVPPRVFVEAGDTQPSLEVRSGSIVVVFVSVGL